MEHPASIFMLLWGRAITDCIQTVTIHSPRMSDTRVVLRDDLVSLSPNCQFVAFLSVCCLIDSLLPSCQFVA